MLLPLARPIFAALVVLGAVPPVAAQSPAPTTQPAGSAGAYAPRGGLPNAAAKLTAGGPVTVAFIGGPITGSGGERGYPEQVARWLRMQYPKSRVKLVNAGLVDGGSRLGAARLERDVMVHRPDLLLIEFAVDDTGEDGARHVERLIRKARTHDPTLDMALVYAIARPHLDDYRRGNLPASVSPQERLAEHYGLPSVALGAEVARRVDGGLAKWDALFSDDTRPTPTGHALYADEIAKALDGCLKQRRPGPHAMPEPVHRDLVLFPTTWPAEPGPPPAAMEFEGRTALATYEMPLVGKHWVQSPEFKIDGKVTWRLSSQSAKENGRRLNDGFGLDRRRWGQPLTWFEEVRYFHGPSGVYLVFGSEKYNNLAARENDLPIVHFIAPQAGRYVVTMAAREVAVFGQHTALALNVVHFPAGKDKGHSIAFHRTQLRIEEPPNIEREVTLGAGDEIAFQLDTNAFAGGGGAVFRDIALTIGYFGE